MTLVKPELKQSQKAANKRIPKSARSWMARLLTRRRLVDCRRIKGGLPALWWLANCGCDVT
jgi:hypothetical protein